MRRLLLFGAVVTFVAGASAEPPPNLPFESMNWPASMKHEPTKGVSLGALRVTFETTTLPEVQKAASAGTIGHTGDAGGSLYWLCYTAPLRGDTYRVWIISHGEMGGPEESVTAFAARHLAEGTASSDCPALPAALQPVSLDAQVWLGSTDAELLERLGAPSHKRGLWRAYNFRTKIPGDCAGGYDMLNWLFTKSERGQVSVIYAGQVSSC